MAQEYGDGSLTGLLSSCIYSHETYAAFKREGGKDRKWDSQLSAMGEDV